MNTILEIKSEMTVNLSTWRLQEKTNVINNKGYTFEVWIYDDKKKKKQDLIF